MTATTVVVLPDRLQLLDLGLAPTEHVQIGAKAWIKSGAGPWEDHPFPEALAVFRAPLRADDWSWELRAARSTGPRELGGVRCLGYEYTLAAPERTATVRMWVAEGTRPPQPLRGGRRGGRHLLGPHVRCAPDRQPAARQGRSAPAPPPRQARATTRPPQ